MVGSVNFDFRGRLTLNVLLSFAQFEREVTSERIRDKISASKRKGMSTPRTSRQLRISSTRSSSSCASGRCSR